MIAMFFVDEAEPLLGQRLKWAYLVNEWVCLVVGNANLFGMVV